MSFIDNNMSLYKWFKSNPRINSDKLYPKWKVSIPTVLLKEAEFWHNYFVSDANINPGDGLLYFYDFILNSPNYINISYNKNIYPKNIHDFNSLFNYLYSLSQEKTAVLTYDSERILALTMLNNPRLCVPVYNKRKIIDFKSFNDYCTNILNKRNLNYTNYLNDKYALSSIEHWLWEAVLGFKFPLLSNESHELLLNIWAGYTYEAIKRFVTLINSNRNDLKKYLIEANKIFVETKSLLECNGVLYVDDCKVPKMSSIDMMRRFHDKEHLLILKEQSHSNDLKYKWSSSLTNILKEYPEWYIPTEYAEVFIRGTNHSNCVGSYANRHFRKPENNNKTLLLFSDLHTAEINLNFSNNKVIKSTVIQVRAKYNELSPKHDQQNVFNISQKFINIDINDFIPVKILKNQNTENNLFKSML